MQLDSFRAVQQLALSRTPISLGEMREFVIRHLLSDPDNINNIHVSKGLIDTYINMVKEEYPDWALTTSKSPLNFNDDFAEFYDKHYQEGYASGVEENLESGRSVPPKAFNSQIPLCLPLTLFAFPSDVIAQFAAIKGYIDATGQ